MRSANVVYSSEPRGVGEAVAYTDLACNPGTNATCVSGGTFNDLDSTNLPEYLRVNYVYTEKKFLGIPYFQGCVDISHQPASGPDNCN